MKIYFATDHAGFEMKEALKEFVLSLGHEAKDLGALEYDENDDYPDYISKCAKAVQNDKESLGIILGGSGQGEAMVANRFKGIRCTVYYGGDEEILKLSKEHNNANILSLGSRFMSTDQAKSAVQIWLGSKFSGEERHKRRVEKMDNLENSFDKWNETKKITNIRKDRVYFRERDVFIIKNGLNIGFEQDGKGEQFLRPVIVFKKFNKDIFWGIPLTRTHKDGKYYSEININKKESYAILSQIRLFDARRFVKRLGTVSVEDFDILK